jgi:7-carboxy-7-deazaguanine synthase
MRDLLVSEVFGPTIQGEGPASGRLAHFVRLGLCNLDCSWCDTPYTWDWSGKIGPPQDRSALEHVDPDALAAQMIHHTRPRHVIVVTGGEPLVQMTSLTEFVSALGVHREVHVETNGTLMPAAQLSAFVKQWVVSPKVTTSSGQAPQRAVHDDVLREFAALGAAFKFVLSWPSDLDDVDRLVRRIGVPSSQVWLMPEGRDAAAIVERTTWLADLAVKRSYNLSSRLHVLAWGDRRGV